MPPHLVAPLHVIMSNYIDLCKGRAFIHNRSVVLHENIHIHHRGGMCMWRQRYPKSTGKAESKAVRQFNMRGYGDQEDDALLSCACPKEESTLQTTARGLPLLTLPAFVRLTQTSPLKSVSTFYVSPTRIRRFLSHNRGVGTSVLPELSGFILSLYSFGSLNCFTFLLIQRPPYLPITPTN